MLTEHGEWAPDEPVADGLCACGAPRLLGPSAYRDAIVTVSIRCAACEERARIACRRLEGALAVHLGPRRLTTGTVDVKGRAIDSRPCDPYVDTSPRAPVTEDDPSC